MDPAETPPACCPQCRRPFSGAGPCPECALIAATRDKGTNALVLSDIPRPGEKVAYIGDYEVLEEIAHGGMGVVYKARQTKLNRMVALKLLLSGTRANQAYKDRFHQEIAALAQLQHPGIVTIFEAGEHQGRLFFSMEFVPGTDLAQLVRKNPLPATQAAGYLQQVAEAIHYAHDQKVLHRDLKPANILLGMDGRPRVTDFGLARQTDAKSFLTLSGAELGTPEYMPPEQVKVDPDAIGPASDVYGLGAVLYHLLTGRPPFLAGSKEETFHQVVKNEPAAPRTLNPAIPKDLETICLKCLEKEPKRRYASALALAEDLHRWLKGEPILARPVTRLERAVKWYRRETKTATLITAVILVALLGLGSWGWQLAVQRRAERELLQQALELLAMKESLDRTRTEVAEAKGVAVLLLSKLQHGASEQNRALTEAGPKLRAPFSQGEVLEMKRVLSGPTTNSEAYALALDAVKRYESLLEEEKSKSRAVGLGVIQIRLFAKRAIEHFEETSEKMRDKQ